MVHLHPPHPLPHPHPTYRPAFICVLCAKESHMNTRKSHARFCLKILPRLAALQSTVTNKSKAIHLSVTIFHTSKSFPLIGPRQANLVLIAYASSEGSGEPAHPRSLARTFAARSYKQWIKRNLQTESQIPGPSEWLGMRSWNLSWRNARRHKFAWRGSINEWNIVSIDINPDSAFQPNISQT